MAIGTAEYHDELARWSGDRLADLQRMDLDRLSAEYRVDARILANQLELCRFASAQLREHEWNPMLANPGRAIYLLLARDFAALPDRLRSVAGRLAAVPEALAAARSVAAGPLPEVHLETALSQFAGTEHLIGTELDRTLSGAPDELVPGDLAAARAAALDAIAAHRRWLEQRLADGARDGGFRDPRIGPELFARKLQLTLESGGHPEELLARAQADLDEATGQIAETAARLGLRAGEGRPLGGEGGGRGNSCARCLTRWRPTRPMTPRSSAWSAGRTTPSWRCERACDRDRVQRPGGRDRDAGDRPRGGDRLL